MEFSIFFAFIAGLTIVFRNAAVGNDADRVSEYIRAHDGELLESKWSPLFRGWFGENNSRIYEIRYRDHAGQIHSCNQYLYRDRPHCQPFCQQDV